MHQCLFCLHLKQQHAEVTWLQLTNLPVAQAAVSSRCAEVVRHGQQRRAGRCGVRILRAPALEPGGPARPAGPAVTGVKALDAGGRGGVTVIGTGASLAAAGGASGMPSSRTGTAGASGRAATELGAEGFAPGERDDSQVPQALAEEGIRQAQPSASGREQLGVGVGEQANTGTTLAAMEVDLQASRSGGSKKRKKARRSSAQGRGTQGWQQMPG